MNQRINDEAVYRTAPATPGLLITYIAEIFSFHNFDVFLEIDWVHGEITPQRCPKTQGRSGAF